MLFVLVSRVYDRWAEHLTGLPTTHIAKILPPFGRQNDGLYIARQNERTLHIQKVLKIRELSLLISHGVRIHFLFLAKLSPAPIALIPCPLQDAGNTPHDRVFPVGTFPFL